ncbi:MAG: hypothetical protein NTZ71_18260, partial [Planctomycetota bacterium]|nr:hypothetical protein [Planctomycetota bacterium]
KNKLLSAVGFGTIILPCLLCGFFGMLFQNNSQSPVISETPQSNELSLAIKRNMAKNKLVEISSQLESGTDAFIVRDTIFAVEAGFASISRADEVIYQANMSLTPETRAAYQSWRSSIIKAPLSPDERNKIRADREKKEKDQELKARERDAKRGPEEKKTEPPRADEPKAEEPKAIKQIRDAPRKPEKSK